MNQELQSFQQSLLKGCLQNDRKSQRDLYQHFYGYGLSICLRYSDDRDEAVELLNQAFMKIFTSLKKFDMSRPFKPWLRRILINTCINNFRKKNIAPTVELDEAKNQYAPDLILSGISYEDIVGMIRKLSPGYRAVFNLYVMEGYSHTEISKMLGVSIGTSKSNLSKAKKNLRMVLNEYFQEHYKQPENG